MALIRLWKEDGYTARLYNYNESYHGKSSLTYYLYHNDELIFSGSDFCPSPLHDFADDKTLASLLGFLSLKPGDTDNKYFANYSPHQLSFVNTYGEYLSLLASDLENE